MRSDKLTSKFQMALADAQKAKIRRYLGYPDVNRRSFPGMEGALQALSAEGQTEVEDLLAKLANVEAILVASQDRQKVVKAEDVTLAGREEIRALWAEGNRYAQTLAFILDVPLRRRPFGGAPTSGVCRRG